MQIKILYVFLFFSVSCSMVIEPEIMPAPRLPKTLELVAKPVNDRDLCLNVSGRYRVAPTSYEFFRAGEVLNQIESSDVTYISLFNLGNKKGRKKENGYVEKGVMEISHEGKAFFKLTTKHESKPLWFEDVFNKDTGDFDCFEDKVILGKSYFKGGGDGISINLKRYVDIRKLMNGDLLVYEQIASPNDRHHYYHIFHQIM